VAKPNYAFDKRQKELAKKKKKEEKRLLKSRAAEAQKQGVEPTSESAGETVLAEGI
jgi:hypothetical protein